MQRKPVEIGFDRLALHVGVMCICGFSQEYGSCGICWDLIGLAMNVQANVILK